MSCIILYLPRKAPSSVNSGEISVSSPISPVYPRKRIPVLHTDAEKQKKEVL